MTAGVCVAPSDLIRSQTIPDHTTVIIRHELSPYLNLRTDEACVMPLLVTIVTELVQHAPARSTCHFYSHMQRYYAGVEEMSRLIYVFASIIPESCAFSGRPRGPRASASPRPAPARASAHRGFTLLIGPADRGRSCSRLIYIVSTEPMREKFT